MAMTTCPECGGAVSDKAQFCPHCGYPIQTVSTDNVKEKRVFSLEKGKMTNNALANYLNVLAWIVLIGGCIIAIASGIRQEVVYERYSYDTKTTFSFLLFITALVPYVIDFFVLRGVSQLCQYVQNTYEILNGMKLKERVENPNVDKQTNIQKREQTAKWGRLEDLSEMKQSSEDGEAKWICTNCNTTNYNRSNCYWCGSSRTSSSNS